jgi:hypothetical protein
MLIPEPKIISTFKETSIKKLGSAQIDVKL